MPDALEFSVDLARQAGSLLRRYFNPAGIPATAKADHSVVTEADFASDRMLTKAFREQFPQDEIISEESSHRLHDSQSPAWIIDPLDGTTNFSLGLSTWGVSIARTKDGVPELGVLFFPMIDELYTARRREGAFLNGKPIAVRAPNPDQPMSFFACCSRTFRHYDVSFPYKPRILGSCAYSYCMVARGSALLGFDATAKAWDLAAVWVLVQEAGGRIDGFEGLAPFPLTIQEDYSKASYPTLAAATPELFALGKDKIRRKAKSVNAVRDRA